MSKEYVVINVQIIIQKRIRSVSENRCLNFLPCAVPLSSMSLVKTVILAAGKGKRMGASVPKPLVQIAGRPMVAHLVETVTQISNEKPIVVISPSGEMLFKEALRECVAYAMQHEALGTGDAVKASRELWNGAQGIMVLYADHPFLPKKVLESLMDSFARAPLDIHMLTAIVPHFHDDYAKFASWGRIVRDEKGSAKEIREAKDASENERAIRELNPAMYIFPAAWLSDALDRLRNDNASGEYYLTDVIGLATQDGLRLHTTQTDALSVIGVNTPEDLKDAEAYKKSHEE